MIIRCLGRRPAVFHSIAASASRTPSLVRTKYTVPSLLNHDNLQKRGVPGLLSPKGFKVAYTEYQEHVVDQLNEVTAGKSYQNLDTKSLVIELARDPTRAYDFNVASMAFNNHFFFRGLNTNPDVQSRLPSDLDFQIRKEFSSLDTLRVEFLAVAEAMFGPGFVWLVQTTDSSPGKLRILPTYLAGSPLSGAHYRRQSEDKTTQNADSQQAVNKVGSFGAAAQQKPQGPKRPLGGIDTVPLLCVNTWEHVWLHDYGVKGKRKYLEAWWNNIDWDLVRQNATIPQDHGSKQFHYG